MPLPKKRQPAPETLESLLDLYENSPCGFHSLDPEGVFVRINDTELKWLGYRREELVHRKQVTDILAPASRRTFEEHFPRLKAGSALRDLEAELVRKDGSLLPVQVSATGLYDADGNYVMSRAVVVDLSDRKRAEEEVRSHELRYRLLFENSMDAIFLTAPDGRIFDANPSACSIFGRTREEIIAEGREGLMDMSDANMARLLEERERTGKTHGELTARRPDGGLFPVEISSAIFRDTHGHASTCLILRDISRRKEQEAEREKLIAELQDALGEVKVLSGLLSICASCKKIRDERGNWETLEVYIRDRSAADFSHAVCPDCMKKLYPDYKPRR